MDFFVQGVISVGILMGSAVIAISGIVAYVWCLELFLGRVVAAKVFDRSMIIVVLSSLTFWLVRVFSQALGAS